MPHDSASDRERPTEPWPPTFQSLKVRFPIFRKPGHSNVRFGRSFSAPQAAMAVSGLKADPGGTASAIALSRNGMFASGDSSAASLSGGVLPTNRFGSKSGFDARARTSPFV